MAVSNKYCEYFDVNETYFPCIDESAINAGVQWEATYPHDTFIEMLNSVDKMLGGGTNRSLWIHGAYGTGKSRCAYALKRILEVPEEELRAYWNMYEPLQKHTALLEKLLGHKEHGIVTAYRYASGSITSPQQLFLSIGEIYDFLETKYGFPLCHLSAFIVGFLLREYSADPYRCLDADGHPDTMTPDKLSEMIGNYLLKKGKTTYIVSLTDDEKAFYEMTEEAWSITPNSCSSPTQAGTLIQAKMRELVYPVWCLEEVDTLGVFDIVKKYISLVQSDGQTAHGVANELGRIARQRPSCGQNMQKLLSAYNCQKGMLLYLERFENGKLIKLAQDIGATDHMLSDIKKLFSVKHSAQWVLETGEAEIRKLIVEYEVIKLSNLLLNVSNHTKDATFKSWRETLKFIGFSCESMLDNFLSPVTDGVHGLHP